MEGDNGDSRRSAVKTTVSAAIMLRQRSPVRGLISIIIVIIAETVLIIVGGRFHNWCWTMNSPSGRNRGDQLNLLDAGSYSPAEANSKTLR
jgi:hypothetical protein